MEKQDEETLLDHQKFFARGSQGRKNETTEEGMKEEEEGECQEEEEEEDVNEGVLEVQGTRGQGRSMSMPTSASFPRFPSERTPLLRPSPSFVG